MKKFSQISQRLAINMSDLSSSAKWVFVLLLIGRSRNKWTGEIVSKEFDLSYLDFKVYGLSRKKYDRNIKELTIKKYIQVFGKQRTKVCRLLKW